MIFIEDICSCLLTNLPDADRSLSDLGAVVTSSRRQTLFYSQLNGIGDVGCNSSFYQEITVAGFGMDTNCFFTTTNDQSNNNGRGWRNRAMFGFGAAPKDSRKIRGK